MTTPPSTKLNCARTDCEHYLVPATVTRRSQDWTGHRLGGIKPGGPVNPQLGYCAFAALLSTRTLALTTLQQTPIERANGFTSRAGNVCVEVGVGGLVVAHSCL